ncbi:MAG: hypothetical protein ACTTJS_02285 [Wolinella sp.]
MQENQHEIIEGKVIEENKKSSTIFLVSLVIIFLLLGLGGFYLYTLMKNSSHDSTMGAEIILPPIQNEVAEAQLSVQPQVDTEAKSELERLKMELDGKNRQIEQLKERGVGTASEAMRERLRYTIRPKERIITECHTMSVGIWQIPDNCALSLAANVNKELESDKRVVAFEVQGIVDTTPYRGLSPELKQEGLASFRAHAAIKAIGEKLPNAVVFEGASLQEAGKRGYRIKAYFVE